MRKLVITCDNCDAEIAASTSRKPLRVSAGRERDFCDRCCEIIATGFVSSEELQLAYRPGANLAFDLQQSITRRELDLKCISERAARDIVLWGDGDDDGAKAEVVAISTLAARQTNRELAKGRS